MKLEFVPLLQLQRDLYRIPRGRERFREYLRVMLNDDRSDVRLPLGVMNPMGKDHVPSLIDALLMLDADGVAARAVGEVSARLLGVPGEFKAALVVADDLMGGWTNRYTSEFSLRFPGAASHKPPRVDSKTGPISKGSWLETTTEKSHQKTKGRNWRFWLPGVLWTSEAPSAQAAREAVLMPIYRAAYVHQHGSAHTLGEMLAQEGYVMAMAGCTQPTLDADDLAYTHTVIAPHLGAQDQPTLIECLFGDTVARSLGYPPQGLSEWAGLALALHQARSDLALQRTGVELSV